MDCMNRTNCPNCGAALQWGKLHCEFCGTRIVDLTMLDFDTNEPTAFVLKLPHNTPFLDAYKDHNVYVSMMAKPELGLISTTADSTSVYGGWGNPKLIQYDTARNVNIEVSLHSYTPPGQKDILRVYMEKRK